MNFVGHALTATWVSTDPRFVLGAMLPDFVSMAAAMGTRARLGDGHVWEIREGIAWHHRTDHAFHGSDAFTELTDGGVAHLRRAGLARGPSLAAAHVGIELLLDGELCHDRTLLEHYAGALASEAELEPAIRAVVVRLAEAGAPHWYRDTAEVTRRLFRILAARPRLAIAPDERAALQAWLDAAQPEVRDRLPALLTRLRAHLVP